MERTYPVTKNGQTIGSVIIEEEGLYYHLHCTCKLSVMQRVSLYANNDELGLLVPEGEVYCLSKKIPRKKLSEDQIQFYLMDRNESEKSVLIPVSSGEIFPAIDKVRKAQFVRIADVPMLKLPIN